MGRCIVIVEAPDISSDEVEKALQNLFANVLLYRDPGDRRPGEEIHFADIGEQLIDLEVTIAPVKV